MQGDIGKGLRGPRERAAVLSSSIQKLRLWVLREKEWARQPETKGKGEAGHTAAKDHPGQGRAGSRRTRRRERKEDQIGLPA